MSLLIKARLTVFAACAAMSTLGAQAATLAEWPIGFVGEKQGANGWWYLYSSAKEYNPSEVENQMNTNTDRYYSSSKDNGSAIWYIGTMLPGLNSNPVLRWICPSAATVTIKGTVQNYNISKDKDADGWTFFIRVNGTEKWNKKIAKDDGTSYTFEVTAELKDSDKIDFLMDREANKWFDEGIVKIQIMTKD